MFRAGVSIVPRIAVLLIIRSLTADSLPWGAQSIRQTGISLTGLYHWMPSPGGDIYLVSNFPQGLLTKVDAAGRQIFSTQIAGTYDSEAILLGPDGNVYFSGY